jgi:hypothetical protein
MQIEFWKKSIELLIFCFFFIKEKERNIIEKSILQLIEDAGLVQIAIGTA